MLLNSQTNNVLFLENDLSYKTVTIKGGLSILGTVLWKICLVQVGILAEASQHQERVVHKITAAKKNLQRQLYACNTNCSLEM